MEISIRKIETHAFHGDTGDVMHTYLVVDNGREFRITLRSHRHGSQLGIEGQNGFLYTDRENNTVRMQAVGVGRSCGISIESDEPVEGLSPWSIRGLVMADKTKETKEIRITDEIPGCSPGQPMMLVDGKPSDY